MQSKLFLIFLAIQAMKATGQTPEPQNDRCHLPKLVGSCRASKPRFWYNAENGKCENFVYGGCNGNENNFLTEAECTSACADQGKAPVTPDHQRTIQRTIDTSNICRQPKVVGKCRAMISRFWFNDETKKCEQFIYGGCEANDNNFEKESECVLVCKEGGQKTPARTTEPSTPTTVKPAVQRSLSGICSLPKEIGNCRASMPRFWFNSQSGKCEHFDYGGCDGNANNFKRESKCIATCVEGADEDDTAPTPTEKPDTRRIKEPEDNAHNHEENGAFLYKSCVALVFSSAVFHLAVNRF